MSPTTPAAAGASDDGRSARQARRLGLVCFVSGAAGLIFQVVWFHRAGLVFGRSVWATSLVLSSFMGGLACGSALVARYGHRIRRLVRTYAALEVAVAAAGVILALALPELTRAVVAATAPVAETVWLVNAVRFIVAFVALLAPATAMGATLPLLVAALTRARNGLGPALGHLYGWNTLGAVTGVAGAELWLIGTFGVAGAAGCAALLCLSAAAIAVAAAQRQDEGVPARRDIVPEAGHGFSPVTPDAASHPGRRRSLLAGAFLSGATLLALEVIWFRFLTMYVLSTTLAVSLMLAVVLAAIGLGGLAGSAWLRRRPRAVVRLPVVALLAGCAVIASYAAFEGLTAGTQIESWSRVLWLASVLTLLPSLFSGVLFTLLGDALQRHVGVATRTAGWLTMWNTGGAMCGPPAAAFVLLPVLGMEAAFFVLAATYAAVGVLVMPGAGSWRTHLRAPAVAVCGLALAAGLVRFPFGLMRDVYFTRVARPYAADGSAIVATREGPSETILLMQQRWLDQPVYNRLVTNGFSMSGTAVSGMRYMRYFVYWPLFAHRGPIEDVLVICYGVGVTAAAALDLPGVESVDVVEISPDVVAMSDVIYPAGHPLRDPRATLHIEDGRQFLHTTSRRYDLITGEPPPPRTPGAVNIYTREYFQLIHDRLADGGIATYWLPVARPDPGTNVNVIARAFCDVFADCSLWNATPFDLMLAGTRNASGPGSVAAFAQPWRLPALRARLEEIGLELPQQIGATFLGDAAYLRELTADAPALVDNHPRRLRPDPRAPSLSDPGYGTNPQVTALYDAVLDPERARDRFTTSDYVRRLWPGELIEATLPYFDHQRVLNRVMWDGGRPLAQIDDLHRLLIETPLRTLPLWILGSDDVKARIAERGDDGTGAAEYARGLTALARRDYLGAAEEFAGAERRGLLGDAVRPLRVYALCLAGQMDAAAALAQGLSPRTEEERHFWEWLGSRFGVGSLASG